MELDRRGLSRVIMWVRVVERGVIVGLECRLEYERWGLE